MSKQSLAVKKKPVAKKPKPKDKAKASGPVAIPTKVQADSPDFIPQPNKTTVQLLANIPTPADMKSQPGYVHRIGLGPRATAVVDCGVTVTVPSGFKAVAHIDPAFAGKGLLIDGNIYSGEARIAFRVRNVGREIIPVLHKDRIATLSLEPVYLFDFTE